MRVTTPIPDELLEEAIPLIAEDLREARVRSGMTSSMAAKRGLLRVDRYRTLESGRARRTKYNVTSMISLARRLGLQSVRVSYVDFIRQHIKVDLSTDGPLTIFVDTLGADFEELRKQGHFVSPYRIFALVDGIGFGSTLDSKKSIDKRIVELWVAAVFTLCLDRDQDQDYYVRPIRADAPDAEVLVVNRKTSTVKMIRVEITQHGRHSKSVFDVIGKKLRKRYQAGTVLVVLVEQSASLPIAKLHEFVAKNNPHDQRIYIIGGSGKVGRFKVVPWDKVTSPTADEKAWMEISVDTTDTGEGRCKYDGVVFKPPATHRFRHVFPVFVSKMDLHR